MKKERNAAELPAVFDRRGGRSCTACRFLMLEASQANPLERVAICRHSPPTVTSIPAPGGIMSLTAPPAIPDPDAMWCFQFEPDQPANS